MGDGPLHNTAKTGGSAHSDRNLIQLLVALILRSWGSDAAAASAWVISREITQAEYRWIEQFGGGLRANLPWWGGFDLARVAAARYLDRLDHSLCSGADDRLRCTAAYPSTAAFDFSGGS